jgi:hypothetical protein
MGKVKFTAFEARRPSITGKIRNGGIDRNQREHSPQAFGVEIEVNSQFNLNYLWSCLHY